MQLAELEGSMFDLSVFLSFATTLWQFVAVCLFLSTALDVKNISYMYTP